MNGKRIVITGMGIVSPLGNDISTFWDNLYQGKNGVKVIDYFDELHFDNRLYGLVDNHEFKQSLNTRELVLGRSSAFCVEATRQALADADVFTSTNNVENIGVCLGTTLGDNDLLEKFGIFCGERNDLEQSYSYHSIGSPAQNIARYFRLHGPNITVSTACSSSAYSLTTSCDLIINDMVPIIICGGVESLSTVVQANFIRLNALDSEKIRPFDKQRSGTLLAEGAGILIVESLDNAKYRNTSILGEITGVGLSCDGYHESAPDPTRKQIVRAMQEAIKDAGLTPGDIDCICAHGTGTKLNDYNETEAIKTVFGNFAYETPVTSIKSMLGHSAGAAFCMQAVAACLMIKHSTIVPTINYENKDDECDLDYCVNYSRECTVENVLINSYGFGGNNASIIISKYV